MNLAPLSQLGGVASLALTGLLVSPRLATAAEPSPQASPSASAAEMAKVQQGYMKQCGPLAEELNHILKTPGTKGSKDQAIRRTIEKYEADWAQTHRQLSELHAKALNEMSDAAQSVRINHCTLVDDGPSMMFLLGIVGLCLGFFIILRSHNYITYHEKRAVDSKDALPVRKARRNFRIGVGTMLLSGAILVSRAYLHIQTLEDPATQWVHSPLRADICNLTFKRAARGSAKGQEIIPLDFGNGTIIIVPVDE